MRSIVEGGEVIESLRDRILGRTTAEEVIHPETRKVLLGAGVLLDAASQAGYTAAHAYKFDLARRTGAPPQDAARHLQDAFMGLMKDYQGAAKDVLQAPKK